MKYDEIDEQASKLGRFLTVFQMLGSHELPAVVLESHAEIIHRVSGELIRMLKEHPDARVTIDARLDEVMAQVYQDSLQGRPDIPDTIEDLLNEED